MREPAGDPYRHRRRLPDPVRDARRRLRLRLRRRRARPRPDRVRAGTQPPHGRRRDGRRQRRGVHPRSDLARRGVGAGRARDHGRRQPDLPVAALWASEGRIYQRYGYGLACLKLSYEIDLREVRLSPRATAATGRLRDAAPRDARKDLQQVYERVRPHRPGWSSRDERWWDWTLDDPASRRSGMTVQRAVLFDSGESTGGYGLWRTKPDWNAAGPAGELRVVEIAAATPQAYAALWRFLLSFDLMRTARFGFAALDDPLLYLVDEPRRL